MAYTITRTSAGQHPSTASPRLSLPCCSARNESHSGKSPPASNRLPEYKNFPGGNKPLKGSAKAKQALKKAEGR